MAAPCRLPATHAVPYGNMAAALVQYVVLRGDLARPPRSWPLGAVVAQGCHAALAAVHGYREHPDTGAYLELGAAMRTVVLEAPDENSLLDLAESLKEKGIEHRLWMENPEGIPTCLALRPYPKNQVQQHLRKFKLLK
ncbi:putative peptidyl-tRNA hydrolase PTRHD1 [Poecile atricapillus]|uniref:putative peptidyl-tRNA hydrolase PTRHD1 n=1 Tax=Poecile atricapillus TaxID=48891 RepID=UPI00273A5140|nr:putative peptidyl-tRNA hydrolase PTRHD1 [Poecile atricapillus]XP_058690337.1 putative peptidyl-tRNA hydrolase PTRHD1 [Poecile atricapillus]